MFSLHEKVIIVTGSTQGLGADIARLAAELGAAGLVISGRGAANGQRVAARSDGPGHPHALPAGGPGAGGRLSRDCARL